MHFFDCKKIHRLLPTPTNLAFFQLRPYLGNFQRRFKSFVFSSLAYICRPVWSLLATFWRYLRHYSATKKRKGFHFWPYFSKLSSPWIQPYSLFTMLTFSVYLHFRRKSAICSNKIPSISVDDMPPPAPTLSMINENTYNGNEPPSLQIMQTSQSPKHYSSLHRDKASPHHSKPHLNNSSSSVRRRSSLCKTASPQVAHTGGGRRTSMPAQGQPRQPPTYVLQDELWMTQRNCRSRCILNYSPSDGKDKHSVNLACQMWIANQRIVTG